jgi:formylmethanofuran dehydrogenase subunit E
MSNDDDVLFWLEGESMEYEFMYQQLDLFDKDKITDKKKTGCACAKCGEFYPWGEPNQEDGTLKCWSCRNY